MRDMLEMSVETKFTDFPAERVTMAPTSWGILWVTYSSENVRWAFTSEWGIWFVDLLQPWAIRTYCDAGLMTHELVELIIDSCTFSYHHASF